jgi:DNA-binding NarL/FixJ family response regulator
MQAADNKIKVLVVEDHYATLEGLRAGLSREPDFTVVGTAVNSDQGIAMANELKPDVILLDLHVPGSLGPKTMVQAFCDVPESRVVVFSGEGRMAFVQTVLTMGVAAYLLKSESLDKVAQTIRDVVAGKSSIVSDELRSGETKLTRSEQEVLKMLARGMKYQDIADHRMTSPATVRKQCELLLLKLSLQTREELIAWAVSNGYGGLELEA